MYSTCNCFFVCLFVFFLQIMAGQGSGSTTPKTSSPVPFPTVKRETGDDSEPFYATNVDKVGSNEVGLCVGAAWKKIVPLL
jgi:hypothetical protein